MRARKASWLTAVVLLAASAAVAASSSDPAAAHRRLDKMATALDKAAKEAKAGKLDPGDVRALEQDKGRLLTTFPAPFGHTSFKTYYRALECIDDNGKIADTRNEQVKLQIAQEKCTKEVIDGLEKDFSKNPAAGAALGQARQLLRSIRGYSGFGTDTLVDELTKVRKQKHGLAKLFPKLFGRPFDELYTSLYSLDFNLGKAFREAQQVAAGVPKHRKGLVALLKATRNIVRTLEAHIKGEQLYLYEFDGLHLSFTGPLSPPKQYTVDVSGSACGSDPLKSPWHVQAIATDVPGRDRDVSFAQSNPAGIVTYRFIQQGVEVGTVAVKLHLVAGASPRMELQADETGSVGPITIDPSRNSLKLTKVENC